MQPVVAIAFIDAQLYKLGRYHIIYGKKRFPSRTPPPTHTPLVYKNSIIILLNNIYILYNKIVRAGWYLYIILTSYVSERGDNYTVTSDCACAKQNAPN